MHPGLLLVAAVALIFAPLGLAWMQGAPPRPFRDDLASAIALVGFAILMVEFLLSGRFRLISRHIGMDVTMRLHQLLARTVLVLLLVHPFLYADPFGATPMPSASADRIGARLTAGAPVVTGMVALLLLPVLVLTAVFRDRVNLKYETWRLLHGLGALVIALAGTHHTIAAGRYSGEPWLAGYWLALLAVAILSLAWVYVFKPLRQLRRPYAVRSVRPLAERTWELTVEPKGHGGLQYAAGQFVWLNVGHSPFSLCENPFSISSAPGRRTEVQFVIKELGDFTRTVGTVQPGIRAYLDGPHGNLTLERRDGKGIALIAGGVGVAPLLGILRQLVDAGDRRPVKLVYGNRKAEQIVYRDELDALDKTGNVSVVHVLSEPPAGWQGDVGMLDADRIRELFAFADAKDWLYFVCGPPPMMGACETALLALGVPASQIVSERFNYD